MNNVNKSIRLALRIVPLFLMLGIWSCDSNSTGPGTGTDTGGGTGGGGTTPTDPWGKTHPGECAECTATVTVETPCLSNYTDNNGDNQTAIFNGIGDEVYGLPDPQPSPDAWPSDGKFVIDPVNCDENTTLELTIQRDDGCVWNLDVDITPYTGCDKVVKPAPCPVLQTIDADCTG